jgi:hypothetical protein
MHQNAERELTKEENYKNFYRLASDNQSNLHRMHYENVLKPLLSRQQELENIVNKNANDYERKRAQDELDRIVTRRKHLENIRDKNLGLINEHDYQKQIQRIEQEQKVKDRLNDLQNYQAYVEIKKKERQDN